MRPWQLGSAVVIAVVVCILQACNYESRTLDGSYGEAATDTDTQSQGPFVQVVGTAQDGGFPHTACSCARCELARRDRTARRLVASIALVLPSRGETYLFDATPDLTDQLHMLREVRRPPDGRVDRSPLHGIFLTHAHIGHYLGLAFLGYEAVHTTRLPVYATPRMSNFLRTNGPWSQLVELENIELREIVAGSKVRLGDGVTVEPFLAPHRDEYADTIGYVIRGPKQSLAYLPDTDSWLAWDRPVDEFFGSVDLALLDGTFFSTDELPGRSVEEIGHPLILSTMDLMAELVSSTAIYFTHLNHSNPILDSDGQALRTVRERGFDVAREGERFEL